MKLVRMDRKSEDFLKLEKLNNDAFPENERVEPNKAELLGAESECIYFGIYEEEFCGFFFLMARPEMVYLFFFAIEPEKRCGGIGTKALQMLKTMYSDREIIIDFESEYEECINREERKRRKDFYLRNGFIPTGFFQQYLGCEFEITSSRETFNKKEFESILAEIHSVYPEFRAVLYRK